MLKFKRKLLTGLLAASIAIGSGAGMVWSEAETTPETSTGTETDAEGASSGESASGDEEAVVPVTEDEALAQMTLYAENDNLALYVNEETCVFAIENKSNGYYWWSTPYNYDADPVAKTPQKNVLLSQIYYNAGDAAKSVNSYADSVKKKTFKIEKIDGGVKFTYMFIKTGMDIPVYVTLNENSFEARVAVNEIIEEKADAATSEIVYQLLTLDLLNGLGAAYTDEEGYMLVPDGSGAVINFNNGKNSNTGTVVYKGEVYGRDLAISEEEASAKAEQVYLPVMGIVKQTDSGDNGLLGVVTEGDTCAYINANVSGQSATSYNNIWFSFRLRAADTYQIGTKEPINVYEANGLKANNLTVRYYVLDGDSINYGDLAETYRNYLIEEKGLTKKTGDDDSALYVTMDGGTMKTQSVLGFPANLQTSATTYKQALEIIQLLEENGVTNMQLVYNDYSDGGISGQVTTGVDYSGALGGKDDFTDLYQYIQSQGYGLYPSVDFMEYTESGKGYSFSLNASKRITKAYATQFAFMRNFGVPNTTTRSVWSILSPYYYPDAFRKLAESYQAEGINTISLNQATSTLYSDFSRENFEGRVYFTREDAMKILTDGYKKLNDAGISILAQECNAYALPYVSLITNVPLYSSNYDLFDYDVPFYQMVIHGYIPYSSKPVNASSNADELLLLSAVTGSAANYEFMYEDPNKFTDSEYADYFYAHYQGWLDNAADSYKLLKEVITAVSGQTFEKYEVVSPGVYRATYSNGTVIEVDTGKTTLSIDGKSVNLADYGMEGEGN